MEGIAGVSSIVMFTLSIIAIIVGILALFMPLFVYSIHKTTLRLEKKLDRIILIFEGAARRKPQL